MFNYTTTFGSGAGVVVPTPSATVPTTVFPGTTITSNSTFIIFGPPPPFPAPPRSINFTPLILIFAVIAIIAVPALVYALFRRSSLRRSSSPSRLRRNDHVTVEIASPNTAERGTSAAAVPDSGVKIKKDTRSKEIGNECPVCLSVFADGEEIRRLSACKHAFHVSCIEPWLKDHASCPICRADVPVKQSESNGNGNVNRSGGGNRRVSATNRDDDWRQGLPDASSLV
ncbi:hypothetical protein HA466_0051950 [Hirschfeldia incana]|nr:hypothetical protein HA466_0051950 [Hirschfeldia incana]